MNITNHFGIRVSTVKDLLARGIGHWAWGVFQWMTATVSQRSSHWWKKLGAVRTFWTGYKWFWIYRVYQVLYRRLIEKEEQRFVKQYFWMKNSGPKKSIKDSWPHSELMRKSGPKSNFCSRRLETATYPVRIVRTGRLPLTLGASLPHFFKIILLPVPEYLPSTFWRVCRRLRKFFKESWDWKILAALSSPFSVPRPKDCSCWSIHRVLGIPHESEENRFEWIATGDESQFQYSYPPSRMWARSPTNVVPRTR
jgi:hypothetical protein